MKVSKRKASIRRRLQPLPVAARAVTHEPTATPPNERVTYIHTDALGSPILGTDALGNVVWQEDYQPYGERFLGVTAPSQRLYTGKYAETRSGLVDYGGRWYNPEIGRFYSVDPQGFDAANPHSFNRYAYANNNPYRFIDPDGEAGLDIVKLVPALGASLGGLAAYTQGVATSDAALTHAANAGLTAQMGANIEALASLVTPPGTSRVILNVVGKADTLKPGSFAKESIPAHRGRATAEEQRKINEIGNNNGCHTCGNTTSGTKSGNWIADHQPAQALDDPKIFLPHCNHCKAVQGGQVLQELRKRGQQ